jgi:hypothetical protein
LAGNVDHSCKPSMIVAGGIAGDVNHSCKPA